MSVEAWKFKQIGPSVSRCPGDSDQELMILNEEAAERREHPQYVVIPGKRYLSVVGDGRNSTVIRLGPEGGQPFSAQLKRLS